MTYSMLDIGYYLKSVAVLPNGKRSTVDMGNRTEVRALWQLSGGNEKSTEAEIYGIRLKHSAQGVCEALYELQNGYNADVKYKRGTKNHELADTITVTDKDGSKIASFKLDWSGLSSWTPYVRSVKGKLGKYPYCADSLSGCTLSDKNCTCVYDGKTISTKNISVTARDGDAVSGNWEQAAENEVEMVEYAVGMSDIVDKKPVIRNRIISSATEEEHKVEYEEELRMEREWGFSR